MVVIIPAIALATSSGAMMIHKLVGKVTGKDGEEGLQNKTKHQTALTEDTSLNADQNMASIPREEERTQKDVVLMPEPTIVARAEDGAAQDDEVDEFELWVETDLDAGWCLENNGNRNAAQVSTNKIDWRSECATSTIKRRWCEFEELAKVVDRQDLQQCEGFVALGLSHLTEISAANVDAAFRRLALEQHPDKGGSMEAFQALVNARESAQRACAAA
eukprot:gnl/MRDRNA2_/MRDRNA2_71081_c0_seq1.p1 gnl/MRDRNA2_/MRDRNA2_71081_c0~~gnl/MRDRNA2_/MRDRNA2_71081_c0_seq1.p1  ORF type:complete len:218 (+),score=55.00 gnl/MRDRNA2_/MRDRNA2_71081_c0_seq1:205-858(+)